MTYWSKLDEEKRLCNMWLNEPLINPESGHPIERNGPTFNSWKERCKLVGLQHKPKATKEMTWRKCQEWQKNPSVNPDSGAKIKINGPTYNWIKKECRVIEKSLELHGEYYIPDKKGMVPSVLYRGTFYVLRTFENRKVWGPLNKPAKNIQLCYYIDTWDYHYNHYRPIFIGRQPKRPDIIEKSPRKKGSKKSSWVDALVDKNEKNSSKYIVDNVIDLFISKQ